MRQLAPERLDHDIRDGERVSCVRRLVPALDRDAHRILTRKRHVDLGAERMEDLQIVDEKTHAPAVLRAQLPRETPAHANVAEVVDDCAEDVAGEFRIGGMWSHEDEGARFNVLNWRF